MNIFELCIYFVVEFGLVVEQNEPDKHAFVVDGVEYDVHTQDFKGTGCLVVVVISAQS